MATNESYLANFEQTRLLSDWEAKLNPEEITFLTQSGVLKIVAAMDLIGWKGFLKLTHAKNEYEIVELKGIPHVMPTDFSEEAIEITDDKKFNFAKLDLKIFLKNLTEKNKLDSIVPPFTLPEGIQCFGGKHVSSNQTIYFLIKPLVSANDAKNLKEFFDLYAKGNTHFVFVAKNFEVVALNCGDKFSDNVSFGMLPVLEKDFKINPALIYRSEFGYTVQQVLNETDNETLIVDKKSSTIFFGKQEILKGNIEQYILLEYLIEHPDSNVTTDYLAHTILNKAEWTNSSGPIRDLKSKIFKKAKTALGETSAIYQLFKEVIPEKPRAEWGNVSLDSKKISIVILSQKPITTPKPK